MYLQILEKFALKLINFCSEVSWEIINVYYDKNFCFLHEKLWVKSLISKHIKNQFEQTSVSEPTASLRNMITNWILRSPDN